MKLTMAQPKGTTHWKIELQMDLNVEELGVRTSDASLTLLTSNSFQLVPLSNNDFQVQRVENMAKKYNKILYSKARKTSQSNTISKTGKIFNQMTLEKYPVGDTPALQKSPHAN